MDNNSSCDRSKALPVLAVLILGASFIAGKYIETRRDPYRETISVQGEGKVFAVPDIASLSFGVSTGRQKTAEGAMTMLSEKMNAIMDAVKEQGVEEKDIRSQYLSLNPSYDWEEGKRTDQGYEASQTLIVKVRDLAKISDVLDAAVSAGANQAGNVSFTIDDPEELQAEARDAAIKDAQQKAKVLAAQLGVTFGSMTGFWEEQGGASMYREDAMAYGKGGGGEAAGAVMPVLPAGEQEIVVRVNVSYEIDD